MQMGVEVFFSFMFSMQRRLQEVHSYELRRIVTEDEARRYSINQKVRVRRESLLSESKRMIGLDLQALDKQVEDKRIAKLSDDACRKQDDASQRRCAADAQLRLVADAWIRRDRQAEYSKFLATQIAERHSCSSSEDLCSDSTYGCSSMDRIGAEGMMCEERSRQLSRLHADDLLEQARLKRESRRSTQDAVVEDEPCKPQISRDAYQRGIAEANKKMIEKKSLHTVKEFTESTSLPSAKPHTKQTDFRGLDTETVKACLVSENRAAIARKLQVKEAEERAQKAHADEQRRLLSSSVLSHKADSEKKRCELQAIRSQSLMDSAQAKIEQSERRVRDEILEYVISNLPIQCVAGITKGSFSRNGLVTVCTESMNWLTRNCVTVKFVNVEIVHVGHQPHIPSGDRKLVRSHNHVLPCLVRHLFRQCSEFGHHTLSWAAVKGDQVRLKFFEVGSRPPRIRP